MSLSEQWCSVVEVATVGVILTAMMGNAVIVGIKTVMVSVRVGRQFLRRKVANVRQISSLERANQVAQQRLTGVRELALD